MRIIIEWRNDTSPLLYDKEIAKNNIFFTLFSLLFISHMFFLIISILFSLFHIFLIFPVFLFLPNPLVRCGRLHQGYQNLFVALCGAGVRSWSTSKDASVLSTKDPEVDYTNGGACVCPPPYRLGIFFMLTLLERICKDTSLGIQLGVWSLL